MMTSKDKFVSPDGERQFFDQAASWDKTIIFFNSSTESTTTTTLPPPATVAGATFTDNVGAQSFCFW